jgi:hypothetical protein
VGVVAEVERPPETVAQDFDLDWAAARLPQDAERDQLAAGKA